MFMTAAEREFAPSPVRADLGRSPFVRLRELLGDARPGMPAISLAVGEPQHGVPSFVGPVLAAHIAEFGRYPMNKGLDEMCEAAAGWLGAASCVWLSAGPCGESPSPLVGEGGTERSEVPGEGSLAVTIPT